MMNRGAPGDFEHVLSMPLMGTMSCRDRYPIPHACGKTCKAASFIVSSNGMDKTCSEAGTQIEECEFPENGSLVMPRSGDGVR